ncbi:MAG: hypothetical protein MUP09_05010, partial [Thiovulaceae bacterium]|nr:hypothetical protein [Sulfurimonadaceae bacterium]
MKKLILSLAAAPLILTSMAVSASAAEDGFNVFSDVKFTGELRPRYEFTDHAVSALDAGSALTNRTNLNLSAKLFEVDGLNATVELNAVNDFNTLDQQNHQTAAEKAVAKMSQANVSYTTAGVTGIVGRKTVNLDNQRFIGSVGWKQNFQTLDLAAVAYGIGDFNILAAYVYGVNAIGDDGFGQRAMVYTGGITSGSTTSAAINASYKIADPIKLTGYAYLLGSYSDTYGIAATGNIAMGDSAKLDYRAEVAMQTDATLEEVDGVSGDTSLRTDAMYYNLDVGANISGFLVGVNYEVLGGDDDLTDGRVGKFDTPLATKHKFNGWADQFLATPGTGLADFNVRAGYQFATAGKIIAMYHMFNAVEDAAPGGVNAGDAYGSE